MNLVEIKNYSFTYPEGREEALSDISLSLRAGSFTVLCGQSGCGKSTLLRQLKTVLSPHGKKQGTIFFGRKPLEELGQRTQSARIGFVMQDPDSQIVTDKVWHELAFGLESLGYDTATIRLRVAEMASYFGIQQWFYKGVEELSGGQKQLLNLAAIMAMHPSLLILDEPTSQLDPIAASDFLETVKKINRDLGITVLMTEHRLEEVFPAADRTVVMEKGHIIYEGTPKETGMWLYDRGHEMFAAMPAPMQIYAGTKAVWGRTGSGTDPAECRAVYPEDIWTASAETARCPMTVREGRDWLNGALGRTEDFAYLEEEKKSRERHKTEAARGRAGDGAAFDPVIELDEVWFRYDRDLPDVVKGLTMQVRKGEFYCLLGGNGTGKSTTLSLVSRVRRPYRGRIRIAGRDIRSFGDRELYRSWLGVAPQNPQSLFVKKTVELELYEMIGGTKERVSADFPVDMEKREVVEQMAAVTRLDGLMAQHPYDLSGGEQQRLALAKILLLRPKILLLDEPTKGLDAHFKEEFAGILKTLQAHGVTVFMISHDIEFCARYADRCGMFFDGNIVTENPPGAFFAGNNFYTTSANRMARHIWPGAVTAEDVIGEMASHPGQREQEKKSGRRTVEAEGRKKI